MQVWDHNQFQETFKNELWSHSRAVEEEKSYKTETLKQPKKPKRDTFAEMEEKQRDIPLHRDSRRFVMVEDQGDDYDDGRAATLPSRGRIESDEKPPREEYELKDRPPAYSDDAGENDPLVSKDKKKNKEKKKGKKGSASRADDDDEGDGVGETTPLYHNPVYVSKKGRDDDHIELQDETKADSWV